MPDVETPWVPIATVVDSLLAVEREALTEFWRVNDSKLKKSFKLEVLDFKVKFEAGRVTGFSTRFFGTIKTVPPGLAALSELETLSLERYFLKEFPVHLAGLKKLRRLLLKDNSLSTIPEGLVLSGLESIDLSENKFKAWPAALTNWPSLQRVVFAKNELKELPDELSGLGLRYLDVQSNKLKKLPESLTRARSLEVLIVSDNSLTELPHDLGALTALTRFGASRNKLKAVPESLGECIKLDTVFLQKNALKTLPDLTKLTSLKKLDVSDNALSALAPSLTRPGLELKAQNNQLTGFAPVAQLEAQVSDSPWRVLNQAEAALQGGAPALAAYRAVALRAVRSILADFDEHGAANKEQYGNKPASYFKKKLKELEVAAT